MTKVRQFFQDANIGFRFSHLRQNPEWFPEKLDESLRACLLYHNATPRGTDFLVRKNPKWFIHLEYPDRVDTGTGEIIYEEYITDEFKTANNRKIKTINRFCDVYEPLYKSKKVSLLFHTFTRADMANKTMRRVIDDVKEAYLAIKRPIRGYLWAMEIAPNEKMQNGYHIHYHLIVAIDRLQVQKIPEKLKLQSVWGQFTQVEFIKKTVRGYLMKYLSKPGPRSIDHRMYAISRNLK